MNARIGHEDGNIEFGKKVWMTDDLTPLTKLVASIDDPLLFFNVGADGILGDAFGPLLGTLLLEAGVASTDVVVLGTTTDPIHATNIGDKIRGTTASYATHVCIATDCAVGDELGRMSLAPGMLVAGLGVGRQLPPIGDYALMACTVKNVNGCAQEYLDKLSYFSSIGLVYGLARKTADAILAGLALRAERKAMSPECVSIRASR